VLSEKQGIEIDVCQNCRGIWLDRGELDKIIERSSSHGFTQNYQQNDHYDNHKHHDDHGSHNQYDNHNQNGIYNQQRKKSWLNELFD